MDIRWSAEELYKKNGKSEVDVITSAKILLIRFFLNGSIFGVSEDSRGKLSEPRSQRWKKQNFYNRRLPRENECFSFQKWILDVSERLEAWTDD